MDVEHYSEQKHVHQHLSKYSTFLINRGFEFDQMNQLQKALAMHKYSNICNFFIKNTFE